MARAIRPPSPDASKRVHAEAYDAASGVYDTYEGLFFPYLFGRIRGLIEERLIPSLPAGARVLDVGCGTGQQTLLFDRRGFRAVGIDISPGLVAVANGKLGGGLCLVADACSLPFPDASFDAVSSAGSTINHVPDYPRFFEELGRVLRPGGYVFLESDNKWKPDIMWSLASALAGDPLGYHETLRGAVRYVVRPIHEGYPYVFPLDYGENTVRLLHLRTFTFHELKAGLDKADCDVVATFGAHSVTNLMPSTIMLRDRPGRLARALFSALRQAEDRVYGRWPFSRMGMSIMVIGRKRGGREK